MKRRIRPFPLALLLVILALAGSFIGYAVKIQQVNANFHYNSAYDDLNLNRPKSVFKRLSADGYDLSMPGLSGPVTFTSPCDFSFFQDFKEHDVKKATPSPLISSPIPAAAAPPPPVTAYLPLTVTNTPPSSPSAPSSPYTSPRWSRTALRRSLKRISARPCPGKPPMRPCGSWTGSSMKPGSTIPRTTPLTRCSGSCC